MTPSSTQTTHHETTTELPLEENFIEQAEYLERDKFLELSAEHPDEQSILRRLTSGGAKLLVGPRGCGKSTLMLKAYYRLLTDPHGSTLPIYVNYKLALKMEPLYIKTSNATFWFRTWLTLKLIQGLITTCHDAEDIEPVSILPKESEIKEALAALESGNVENKKLEKYSLGFANNCISAALEENNLNRCIVLFDDAAHAFSDKQQEDFFEFFREIKGKNVAPKAAIYPGITSHSPAFHVGHDAEQIDVWLKPSGIGYEAYMTEMARRRFGGTLPDFFDKSPGTMEFLAYTAFGVPRSFLSMLRSIYNNQNAYLTSEGALDRRKVLELAKQGRELSHGVYNSLESKLPSYRNFVDNGRKIYQAFLETLKEYNKEKEPKSQATDVGIKKPIAAELEKVLGFLQYAGLLMPVGENMRGIKGTFEIYTVHYGDLVSDNAIIGKRTKSVDLFLEVFRTPAHQAWPRISDAAIRNTARVDEQSFKLVLPHCQRCGAERLNSHAKFCHNCGAPLKSASLYEELIDQDISVLPIGPKILKRIKDESPLRKVRDILIDTNKENLRGVSYIGPVRAQRIVTSAEEYLA